MAQKEGMIAVDHFASVCRCCLCDCKRQVSYHVDSLVYKNAIGDLASSFKSTKLAILPKTLCQQCFEDLTSCYEFITKYQRCEQTVLSVSNQKEARRKRKIVRTSFDEIEQGEIQVDPLKLLEPSYQKQSRSKKCKRKSANKCRSLEMKSYVCNVCKRVFHIKSKLEKHVLTHSKEKPYKCSFCEKAFALNGYRIVHERIHTGEKPYVCNICNRSFSDKSNFRTHLTKHSNRTPYQCSFCEKKFKTKAVQLVHEKIHLGIKKKYKVSRPKVKLFQCNFCEKNFWQRAHQIVHERTHTGEMPYKCSFCGRSFARKDNCNVHERTHTGEKPYKCNFCDWRFTTSNVKVIHERTHTGEKPYKCSYCEKGFAIRRCMLNHERKHRREK